MYGLRSKIFRQVEQINRGKADALPRFFGQADGIIFKQAVRLDLCGVALAKLPFRPSKARGEIPLCNSQLLPVRIVRQLLLFFDRGSPYRRGGFLA